MKSRIFDRVLLIAACFLAACAGTANEPGIPEIHVQKAPFAVPVHFSSGHFYNTDTSIAAVLDTIVADSLVNGFRTKCIPLPVLHTGDSLWRENSTSSVVWIGHASYYIRIRGFGILTDPVFSDRISPVPFYGPKRQTPPGRALGSLPGVSLVVISHSHYDHLDKGSIQKIHRTFPKAIFAVPLGIGDLLRDWGIPENEIAECDWWDSFDFENWKMTFVPAHHTSRRGAFDSSVDISLWGGWVLENSGKKIWFAGDLGFGDGSYYKQISKRFAPFDICFLPIGGYKPSRYTRIHISPRQAVKLHLSMRSKKSFAMHWGTFGDMTFEAPLDPPKDLENALRESGVSADEFITPTTGEILPIEF